MKRVEKKAWPEWFAKVLDGSKTYDLRLNDFEIQEGDTLVLKEWDPKTKQYTGREIEKTVGSVGKFTSKDLEKWWPRDDIGKYGLQVISLK
ncbi:hypothetical protein A3H77_01680 [Candidatus Kaiserbacteria bacterium RIFCSPLOWO2_02_FULL_56_11]|uniref:DUF3850 domain-containing protein n=1 Tax=Candidatus Kaiserbacteria bacterium RIFCSPHIGHO2_12_FULL_56_13 TaxID=1798505 RepID=A0A1F6EFD1_9BACT|nr:MAG: hypothetical protein A3E65_02300 [Candidatus Kaiserbacteria bacterium RIFCSPHIGHO2_12_FULL_56_13]OGG82206.1 MAG: hypothetical protein A3H77_01680 [Candidatus Kaiserbacteria bacterium RIFCSPLOWO2_02_FULL_56_11]